MVLRKYLIIFQYSNGKLEDYSRYMQYTLFVYKLRVIHEV